MATTPVLIPRARKISSVAFLLIIATAAWWHQRGSLESSRQTYHTKLAQLAVMQDNTRRLEILRAAPRRAADRQLPHNQLVAEIEESCARASISLQALTSIWPESPRRLKNSDYMRLATRISFEQISLQQIMSFAHGLRAIDSSLNIGEIRLSAVKGKSGLWNAELNVAYLIYMPQGSATKVEAQRS